MKTVTFPKDLMREVLWDETDRGRVIEDNIVDNSRWSIQHELVFELDGQTYRTHYSVGATEYQDERPWEYEPDVQAVPVHQVEKTVKVWEPLPA